MNYYILIYSTQDWDPSILYLTNSTSDQLREEPIFLRDWTRNVYLYPTLFIKDHKIEGEEKKGN